MFEFLSKYVENLWLDKDLSLLYGQFPECNKCFYFFEKYKDRKYVHHHLDL